MDESRAMMQITWSDGGRGCKKTKVGGRHRVKGRRGVKAAEVAAQGEGCRECEINNDGKNLKRSLASRLLPS